MEFLASAENITKLLDHIITILEENEQSDSVAPYMAGLRNICFGNIAERGCFNFLSLDEKLSSIMEMADFDRFFKMRHNECFAAIDHLINLSCWPPNIRKGLMTLISNILEIKEKDEAETKMVMTKIFHHKDFCHLPVESIEKMISYDSTNLELYLIDIYAEQRPNMLPWNAEDKKHWLNWCSLSSILFYEFLCILNELLIRVKNQRMIEIIRNFVDNISKICNENNIDFISLYPLRLQYLISFMHLDFMPLENSSVCRSLSDTFRNEFNRFKLEYPAGALVILSHFAKSKTFLS